MRDPEELVTKRAELTKLWEEYAATVSRQQELFGKMTLELKRLQEWGKPGAELAVEIMARFNHVHQDAVAATKTNDSGKAGN